MRLSAGEARLRFEAARVARLATVGQAGEPHLVPVTFAVVTAPAGPPAAEQESGKGAPEQIVFAVDHKPKSSTSLRRLANIAAHPQVAFLVDHYDDEWDQLWWVRADAIASDIEGTDRRRAISALQAKYRQYESHPPGGVVIGAAVTRWSGWQAAE